MQTHAVFNQYWHNYVLWEDGDDLRETRESVLYKLGTIKRTPQQHGGLDCGLFVVGVVLHLLEGIPVDTSSFDRHMVSGLRTSLSVEIENYNNSKSPLKNPMKELHHTSVRKFFPDLPKFDNQPGNGNYPIFFKSSNTSTNPNEDEESDTSDGSVMVPHVTKDKNSSVQHQLAMTKN